MSATVSVAVINSEKIMKSVSVISSGSKEHPHRIAESVSATSN